MIIASALGSQPLTTIATLEYVTKYNEPS